MTATKHVTLHCDWPRCLALFDTGHTRLPKARTTAATAGWVSLAGLDFCGTSDEGYFSSSNHAAVVNSEHQVTIERKRAGYRPSCSCGWRHEPENPLRLSASRDRAGKWWIHNHLTPLTTRTSEESQ